ncbi:MAG: gluconate 2-dehydrogenase subunit 3 family protein [Chitinophagaceae bacterium]
MNRRTAIRNVVVISAGAALLPSCSQQDPAGAIPLKNISLTGPQENMVAELSETIIPKTKNFIGAKDLKAHEFVLTMLDDCTSPEEQKIFINGLQVFEDTCKKKFDTSFAKCSAQQRSELLKEMEASKDEKDNGVKFYRTTKRYTLQSFTSAEAYMMNVRKYKMVPGPIYKGCVPVS